MLLPKLTVTQLIHCFRLEGLLLLGTWVLQVGGVTLGPVQPVRSLFSLWLFTTLYLNLIAFGLRHFPRGITWVVDATVLWGLYALIFATYPVALTGTNLIVNHWGVGGLVSLLGASMAHIPANAVNYHFMWQQYQVFPTATWRTIRWYLGWGVVLLGIVVVLSGPAA